MRAMVVENTLPFGSLRLPSRRRNEEGGVQHVQTTMGTREIAEELLRGIPADVALIASEDDATISYAVVKPSRGWKLSRIVFAKDSLEKLAHDADRDVKIDYIRRDLFRAATRRRQYVYPRPFAA